MVVLVVGADANGLVAIRALGRPAVKLAGAYRTALKTRPLVTNTATMCGLFTVSDVLAQTAVEKKRKLDLKRLRNAAIVGGVYAGTCVPQVYRLFDKVCTSQQHSMRPTLVGG